MKKWTIALVSAVLLAGLTACTDSGNNGKTADKPEAGQTNTDKGQNGNGQGNTESAVKGDPASIKEAVQASAEAKSFSLAMNIKQSMTQEADLIDMDSRMKLDIIKQPFAMYQNVVMNIGGEEDTKFDAYMTDTEYFAHDLITEDWTKMPKESIAEIKATFSKMQTDPGAELTKLTPYLSQMKAEEKDGKRVYSVNLTGTGYETILDDLVKGLIGDRPDADAILKTAKVQKLQYTATVDSATKLPQQIHILTDVVLTVDGKMIGLKQDIKADYSGYNEVKPIAVPEEGRKNALLPPTEEELQDIQQ
ncbi:DUF6612 family protein [Paenibacillus gansuensis]|uniref:DUF6612 family protein n=1 Tax=Paenibacillus gansuensis TaxID=306542 RepID=A0ABW5PJ79_9BACL